MTHASAIAETAKKCVVCDVKCW